MSDRQELIRARALLGGGHYIVRSAEGTRSSIMARSLGPEEYRRRIKETIEAIRQQNADAARLRVHGPKSVVEAVSYASR